MRVSAFYKSSCNHNNGAAEIPPAYCVELHLCVSLCCVSALDNGCLCQHISVLPVHHRDENEIHLMLQLTIQQIDFITMDMAC